VRGILEDDEGFLWIGSDSGLLKFDVETGKVIRAYEEGGRKFNFSPESILKTDKGEMWFSTNLGVIRFNPDRVKDNPYLKFPIFEKPWFLADTWGKLKYAGKTVSYENFCGAVTC
jgi:hypothetical protein